MPSAQLSHTAKEDRDPPATVDDLANLSFPVLSIDVAQVRDVYNQMWTDVAVALLMLKKTPNQARDVAKALLETETDEGGCLLYDVSDGLPRTAKWLEELAGLVHSGSIRLTAGMCRILKEQEAAKPETHGKRRRPASLACRRRGVAW